MMVMTEQEQPNKDLRTRKRLRPYLGQALTFVGYLDRVVYNNGNAWCMLVDCYNNDNQLEVDHVHVSLSQSGYERMKSEVHKMVSFEGTIKKYLAGVKPALDSINDKVHILTKEKRYGIDKVTNINTNCTKLKINYNVAYKNKLTEYEQFALNNLRQQMQDINNGSYKLTPIKELLEDFVRENQDIGKRNNLLNDTQECIDNKDFNNYPDIFIDEITTVSTSYSNMNSLLEERDKIIKEATESISSKNQELMLKNTLLKDKDNELNLTKSRLSKLKAKYTVLQESISSKDDEITELRNKISEPNKHAEVIKVIKEVKVNKVLGMPFLFGRKHLVNQLSILFFTDKSESFSPKVRLCKVDRDKLIKAKENLFKEAKVLTTRDISLY